MIPVVKRDVREVPTGLIDRPELAMRESFDDEAFRELKASITENGIRVALIVVQRGERFRIVAGERRFMAACALQAVTVPCDVQELDDDELEFVKVLENEDRAPVNPAEAATYFMRLFTEKCGEDVDQVCARVRRDRRYVEERLLLFSGDEEVFNTLKAGTISLGVAQELNRITNIGYRRMHLDTAAKYGMTIAAAKEARKVANFAVSNPGGAPDTSSSPSAGDQPAQPSPYCCYICHRGDKVERMRYVMVHEHCDLAIGDRVLAGFRHADAEPEAPNA